MMGGLFDIIEAAPISKILTGIEGNEPDTTAAAWVENAKAAIG